MFSKKYRINSERIEEIFKNRAGDIRLPLFFVRKVKNNLENNRFAIIVPKKVCNSAVKRHLFKRKIVYILKNNSDFKNGSFDFVITLKKEILESSKDQIKSDLDKLII